MSDPYWMSYFRNKADNERNSTLGPNAGCTGDEECKNPWHLDARRRGFSWKQIHAEEPSKAVQAGRGRGRAGIAILVPGGRRSSRSS